ncbi:MAG TPA: hypothetical protein VHZ06_01510 [Marmoricola sp.]|nr:hypothetical protein [Marmoricola sp.]
MILIGCLVVVLGAVVAGPAQARTANPPSPGGGGLPARTPIKMVKQDSKIPTYDYVTFYIDKRATYEVGHRSDGVAIVLGAISLVALAGWVSVAIGLMRSAAALLGHIASGAEHDDKCLAIRLYVQRKKWINPPGPDVILTKVYSSVVNCTGSYSHG